MLDDWSAGWCLIDAVVRLVRLLDHPRDAAVLAPLIKRHACNSMKLACWTIPSERDQRIFGTAKGDLGA